MSNMTIKNCISGSSGGAIRLQKSDNMTMHDMIVIDNSGRKEGGAFSIT